MEVSKLILSANEYIDEGDAFYRKHLLIWALSRYERAFALLDVIEENWEKGTVEISQNDEIALLAVRERLGLAYGRLGNGKGRKNPSVSSEFRDVVRDSLEELKEMFQ